MAKKVKSDPEITWPESGVERKFDPRLMRLPLPFGRLNRYVTLAGLRFIEVEQVRPDLDSRLRGLSKYRELSSDVEAIKKIAAERNVYGTGYLEDWELRARLAEAELVGLYLDASTFAEKVSKKRSSAARKGKSKYPDQRNYVRAQCEQWVREKMPESREAMLDKLFKNESLLGISAKTIEGWWDAVKVELVGKRQKKIPLP